MILRIINKTHERVLTITYVHVFSYLRENMCVSGFMLKDSYFMLSNVSDFDSTDFTVKIKN